jgi:DNA-binding winged helix-turn-helix (wHTH) protein/tetratricopeptide (TPR) repeat protein
MGRYRFDRFELDERSGQLREDGRPVTLQPKLYELLVLLLQHPGRLFSREDLQQRLWPGVYVSEASLPQAIARLRKVLGEELLQTERGRGYRLRAEVQTLQPAAEPHRPRPGLYGREEELGAIARGLQQRRLVWLSGPPGAGKTTLALALRPSLLVPLPPEGGLQRALQRALELPASADLGQALRARGELLVLVDDAQHDPQTSTLLEQWQPQAPEIQWLVTSRERGSLGQAVALGPLPLQPAVRLLSERAGVALDPDEPAVAELVTKLDGNPLALRLAGPRLRVLQPAELLQRLSARFELLRDAGASLSAALGSAWNALDERARADLRTLAALGLEIPMELAESLLGGELEALERLQALVDTSWIEISPREDAATAVLAHSARAWIEAQTDEPTRRQALLRAGQWLEENLPPELRTCQRQPPEAGAWLRQMADILYLAAMQVPPDRSPDLLVQSALVAGDQRGRRSSELEVLLRHALAHPALTLDAQAQLQLRLGMLTARSMPEDALPHLQRALELAEQHSDLKLRSWAWAELAYTLTDTDPASASALAERALELGLQCRDPEYISYARYVRCVVAWASGRADLGPIEELLAAPDLEGTDLHQLALYHHALVLEELGYLAEAEAAHRQMLGSARQLRRTTLMGQLAGVLQGQGRLQEAEAAYGEALEGCRWFGLRGRAQIFGMQRARVRVALGQLEEAERELAELLAAAPTERDRGEALCVSGLLALRQGRPALALHHLETSHTLSPADAQILGLAALAAARSGDLSQAERWLAQAADLPQRGAEQATCELALAWVLKARAEQDPTGRERYEQHLQHLDEAPGPGREPWSRRLVEMCWLRPDR